MRVATQKMPIYTATRSLDVRYKFEYCILENASVKVPAANIHAILYAGCDDLLTVRSEMKTMRGSSVYTDNSKVDKTNFATAAFTLLYTDTTTEEGYLGDDIEQQTFLFNVDSKRAGGNRIVSSMDLYDQKEKQAGVSASKSSRNSYFNALLSERVNTFSAISSHFDLPLGTATIDTLQKRISGEMFHEDFHHSEQCYMHFLSSLRGIQSIVSAAESVKASYVYGIVLDIYTQRMLCCNCNACLLGLQNSHEQGFLHQLNRNLEDSKIQPRINNLMLSVRVSASKAPRTGVSLASLKLPDDQKQTHVYDADDLPIVLQAENKALGTQKLISDNNYNLSSYSGLFFVSSSFPKAKLEEAIALPTKSS